MPGLASPSEEEKRSEFAEDLVLTTAMVRSIVRASHAHAGREGVAYRLPRPVWITD